MDAAQNFRKIALLFAVALLCAGAASAATLSVNPSTVTLTSCSGCSTSFQVISSDGSATPFTATVTSTTTQQFFSISGAPGTASGAAGATVTLGRLSSCGGGLVTCPDGTISIHGGTGPDVTVTVHDSTSSGGGGGGGGGTSVYSSNPNPINVSASNGFSTAQVVTLTSSSAATDTIAVTLSPANTWLSVFPASATVNSSTPAYFQITANSASLTPNQTYNGTVTFTGANGTLAVPINFTVGSGSVTGTITPSPSSVALSYPCGTCVASVGLTSSTATSYTATSNANWLLVNGSFSTVGSIGGNNLALTVNTSAAASLSTSTYSTTVTLTPNVGTASSFTVTLSVNGSTGGGTATGAAPTNLTFAYQIGGPTPLPQQVWVAGSDSYTVTQTDRFFPNVTTIQAPGSFTVTPTVAGISASTTGAIVLTSNSTGASQTIPASLLVSGAAAPVVAAEVSNSSLGDIVCATASGCTVSVKVTASDNSNLAITVASSNSWIVVSNAATTTPGTFTVQLVPTGLSGLNTGTVTVTATGAANSNLAIPVVFALSGSGGGTGTGVLTLNPGSVNFTSTGQQSVNVTAASSTAFSAALGSTNCGWLAMTSTGFTPGTITLTAIANPGVTTTCNITLGVGTQTMTLPVTFTVGGGGGGGTGTITASPMTVNLTAQVGGTTTAQTVQLTGNPTATTFTATAYGLGNRITVTPSSGTTPATLSVTANTAGLQAGTYSDGYIQVPGLSGNINVILTVTAATAVSASPTTLSFNYAAGGAVPTAQTIAVTGVAANLPFSATVSSGADWLSVSPATGTAGTTATNVTVSVNPTSLQANKTYTGTIVVAGTGSATGSTTITVTLVVSAPLPTISRVTNAASFNTGAISAGEIITIFGTAIGPQQLQVASPSNAQYPTDLAGVQVTVGGYLAPLIYVRSDQVSAIVPYEINRPIFVANVPVVVRFLGQGSNGVNLQQTAAAPGIFTTGGGSGQAAALNQNLTVNSTGNPANKGEVIVLYVTGEGQTAPAGVSGKVTSNATTFPVSGQVTVTIDGVPAAVQFAGEAPGLVSGVMQVNAVIPAGLTRSGDVTVVVSVGGASSQVNASGVGTATIAVR